MYGFNFWRGLIGVGLGDFGDDAFSDSVASEAVARGDGFSCGFPGTVFMGVRARSSGRSSGIMAAFPGMLCAFAIPGNLTGVRLTDLHRLLFPLRHGGTGRPQVRFWA